MRGITNIIRRAGYHSKMMLIIGAIVAAPMLVAIFYPEEAQYIPSFLVPGVFFMAFGLALALVTQSETASSRRVFQSPIRKGSEAVLFAWFGAIFAGALPFVIGGQLSFIYALFESVSGWSTTGLTVVDVSVMPHMFLFHRAFMQYCGGLGFIIVISIVLHGKQLTSMYAAEGHPDGIMPSIRRTAIAIISIYMGCLVLGSALLRVCGMSFFESICHTMSALSTAGFSTRVGSIAEYGSLPIEIVTILLMLIGSSNFAVLMLIFRRKLRRILKISEVRFMLGAIALFVPIMMIALIQKSGMGFFQGLREAVFCTVTMFTTTGYSINDYALWHPFAVLLIMLLMVLGGSTGSTAGGIKMLRAYIIVRVTKENIQRRLSPNQKVRVMHYMRPNGEAPIDGNLIRDTFEFATVYFGMLVVGTLLITLFESCSLGEAAFEFTSAFGTIGVSNGLTARASTPTLIVEMVGMLMGRLEVYILFIGLHSYYSSIKNMFVRKRA